PDKSRESIYTPMSFIHQGVIAGAEERRLFRSAPPFAPAGQSTQMIVGATDERDSEILRLSSQLYRVKGMRRVYYSGFVPVNSYDKRLPSVGSAPLVRENRLYQADWLMRFYGFTAAEIADDAHPDLDLEIDPKLAWALRHPEIFPVDVNRAEYGAWCACIGVVGPDDSDSPSQRAHYGGCDGTDGGGNEEGALLRDLRRSAGRGMYRRYDAGTGT
ncbi:MAG: hypothetical protein ACLUZZ_02835, partial [Alistipes inops]